MASEAPKQEPQEKHRRYAAAYKAGEIYWGLGIECEGYIEAARTAWPTFDGAAFTTRQAPERYSVRYYDSYKPTMYAEALKGVIDPSGSYALPLLLNAHSFQRTSAAGDHTTAFKKRILPAGSATTHVWDIIPNPRFAGQTTILEALQAQSPYFLIADPSGFQAESFIFDGDSIEIATQAFYKATVAGVVTEFRALREEFVRELNRAWAAAGLPTALQPLRWMTTNHPWAAYHSNPRNVAIFNNGTYHINFTAPTRLDGRGRIADWPAFVDRHRRIARYIQWLQPFLLIAYGTADPLAKSPIMGHRFAAASQRAAVSRYIGVGTYDTAAMPTGKMNTVPRDEARVAQDNGWMVTYGVEAAYKQLDTVGLDINFNKHYSHGLEFRFFDFFAVDRLPELLAVIVGAADQALSMDVSVPQESPLWNTLVELAFEQGGAAKVYPWMCEALSGALGLTVASGTFREVWEGVRRALTAVHGECSRAMLPVAAKRTKKLLEQPPGVPGPAAVERLPASARLIPEVGVAGSGQPGIKKKFWAKFTCRS